MTNLNIIGYIPAIIPETNKEVIVIVIVNRTNVNNLNDPKIVNYNKATYYTNHIDHVACIISSKLKQYNRAINPYDNEIPEFRLDEQFMSIRPIQIYLDIDRAKDEHMKYNQIQKKNYDLYGKNIG